MSYQVSCWSCCKILAMCVSHFNLNDVCSEKTIKIIQLTRISSSLCQMQNIVNLQVPTCITSFILFDSLESACLRHLGNDLQRLQYLVHFEGNRANGEFVWVVEAEVGGGGGADVHVVGHGSVQVAFAA